MPLIDGDENQFYQYANAQKTCLVVFTMQGCGHCTALVPALQQLGQATPVPILKIDRTKALPLLEKLNVRGYPTIYAMKSGQLYPYQGARDVASLRNLTQQL
jgi:thioredoxin-like negative regulator of GroEL